MTSPVDPSEATPAKSPATAAQRLRRRLLLSAPALALGGLAAWGWRGGGGGEAAAAATGKVRPVSNATTTHRFELQVDTFAAGTAVNRRVAGSNVQWVDSGDNMLGADFRFDPAMLQLAQQMAPTVLRYPGGAQSDNYHWALGMGPQSDRGLNNHVNANTMQVTRFGTGEFLELCEATGAEPLITVNVVTGTPEEAAAWLTAVNVTRLTSSVTGRTLPRVDYWEIGNEPYLKMDSRPDLDLAPDEFARRANLFIRALRAVDPTIRIGLPLTVDRRNGVPVTAYFGFSATVLGLITEPFDYVSLHDAYMPFGLDAANDPTRLYWGAMAGARAVQADFAATRALLAQLRPGLAPLPFAITEYSALFTLGAGAVDTWIATPAGALYVADALRLFANTPDVLLANQWSLSGNWVFGAINFNRYARPAGEAMRLFGEALRGELLPTPAFQVEQVATASVGLVQAQSALPLVEVMLTREVTVAGTRTLRVLLIHKDPTRQGLGSLVLDNASKGKTRSVTMTLLSCTDVFNASDAPGVVTRSDVAIRVGRALEFTLPPCSVALLTIPLGAA